MGIRLRGLSNSWIDCALVALLFALACVWWPLPFGSFGERFGVRLWEANINSGPPSEYIYDFVQSWHFAASLLLYVVSWPARNRDGTANVAWWYPAVCSAITMILPWNEDVVAHKFFGLLLYSGCLYLLLFLQIKMTKGSRAGTLLQAVSVAVACVFVIAPITGGNVFWLATFSFMGLLVGLCVFPPGWKHTTNHVDEVCD